MYMFSIENVADSTVTRGHHTIPFVKSGIGGDSSSGTSTIEEGYCHYYIVFEQKMERRNNSTIFIKSGQKCLKESKKLRWFRFTLLGQVQHAASLYLFETQHPGSGACVSVPPSAGPLPRMGV